MNHIIEKFGGAVGNLALRKPGLAASILSRTYRVISWQAGKHPSEKRTASREYLQGVTAGLMADLLADPSESAVVNIFMPCEIFHAMGIPAMVPEGLSAYLVCTACEQPLLSCAQECGASDTYCSYHRALLGAAESGMLKKPMIVASTTLACDANQLTFAKLAQIWKVPRVQIDVPYDTGKDAVLYVEQQLRDMEKTLEEVSGRKMDPARLKEAVRRSCEAQRDFREYMRLRPAVHLPETFTPELLCDINQHVYLGSTESLEFTRRLLSDVKNAPGIGSRKKIVWMHTLPNWQDSLMNIFQGADNDRVEIVASDLAFSGLTPMDPDRPYESMARRLVEDSFNGPGSRRIAAALAVAQQMEADGIVIFAQWGCRQTQGLAVEAKRVFEENGFPTLILDGDGADRTNGGAGQIVTRADAFVEQLEGAGDIA
ncbi:MAG: 2-hydroxyacyl-CoA dehydratase family protein [Lachnospira sp.]|nr:2-hydroxyacyl-CoA dehydratase family protein [Lachnospira sp.]